MVAKRSSARKPAKPLPGDATDVSRIEFANIETVVRGNADRLIRLEARLEALSRDIAELANIVRALRSSE